MRDTHAAVAAIFTEAGWRPGDGWDGRFMFKATNIVGGVDPWGVPRLKSPDIVKEGHPQYGPDTPDTPVEAAAWLVEHAKKLRLEPVPPPPTVDLTSEATLMPPTASAAMVEMMQAEEGKESVSRETEAEHPLHSEAERAAVTEVEALFEAVYEATVNGVYTGRQDVLNRLEGLTASEGEAYDAEFYEPDRSVLDEDLPEPALLEGEELGPDIVAAEDETAGGAFIFGDNLGHDRIVRIGQLAEHANVLIDACKQGYSENEHNAVRSHVVTNMNEAGAYIGGDQGLFDRFIRLEAVVAKVRLIETYRDAQQDYIRSAMHAEVAAFDPGAGWPE